MRRDLAGLAWPSILVVGSLWMALEPAPCAAQPPIGGMPAMPAISGAMDAQPSPEGSEAMTNVAGTSGNQPPPTPMPPSADLGPQIVGPLPVAAVTPLPALSHDHYGDGAGTTAAGLIWPGQPPHPHDPYEDGAGKIGGPIGPIPHLARLTPHSRSVLTHGALGYGPPGEHPGFYGFGLSFHPGYGYGGNGLGVGAYGGYPCYGGPGYPIKYGYPHFAYPYYEGVGQLYYDPPVVTTELIGAGDFGPYTGASAYAYTHPSYAAEAAATGSFVPGAGSYPDTSATNPAPEATFTRPETVPGGVDRFPGQNRFLGMNVEPGLGTADRKGLKITNILPGSTAANAGLQVGDVILSINGYVTEQLQHLTWIIDNAAPDNTLNLNVVGASDGKERALTIRMP